MEGFCVVPAPAPPAELVPVAPLADGGAVDGCVVEAGGAKDRRTPLPDPALCPPAAGAVALGAEGGELPFAEDCALGDRMDRVGAVLREPRLDAPEPDVALEADDEPDPPEELPPTCACASAAASGSERIKQ